MSWNLVKKVWYDIDANIIRNSIRAYNDTNTKVSGGMGGMTTKEAACLGMAALRGSRNNRDSGNVCHLIIGGFSLGCSYYMHNFLRRNNVNNQRIIAYLPDDIRQYVQHEKGALGLTNNDVILISANDHSRMNRMLNNKKLASVFIYDYNLIFNWDSYGTGITKGGSITFSDVESVPVEHFKNISDWNVAGSYSRFLFLTRRDKYEDRLHDTN